MLKTVFQRPRNEIKNFLGEHDPNLPRAFGARSPSFITLLTPLSLPHVYGRTEWTYCTPEFQCLVSTFFEIVL